MSKEIYKDKFFAVRVFIKSKKVGAKMRGGKTFKGIAKAKDSATASKKVIDILLEALKDETFIPITKNDIVIRECISYNDFAV